MNLASAVCIFSTCIWLSPKPAQLQILRGHQCFHLALHQHGHVHEHVVKLSDAVLQLDNLIVPRLDLIHSLLGDVVHDDLRWYNRRRRLPRSRIRLNTCVCSVFIHAACVVSLTPEVNIAGLSLSNMLSSSSFVVFLPAKRAHKRISIHNNKCVCRG